jgi:hypothetical protein
MTFSAKLDAVAKAKQAYVLARTTLEARLREQMRLELANLQTQIDIAVRYAVDAGESKASVLRALGTKDYNTVKASLDRTQGVVEVVGSDPLANVYRVDGDVLYVSYRSHGSWNYTGDAQFRIKRLDGGGVLFLSETPLWSDDYTVRNDAVVALDGRTDNEYYEEAVAWLSGTF